MSRNHRIPWVARMICTHPRHGGEPATVATARWSNDGHLIPLFGVRLQRYDATGNHRDSTGNDGQHVWQDHGRS